MISKSRMMPSCRKSRGGIKRSVTPLSLVVGIGAVGLWIWVCLSSVSFHSYMKSSEDLFSSSSRDDLLNMKASPLNLTQELPREDNPTDLKEEERGDPLTLISSSSSSPPTNATSTTSQEPKRPKLIFHIGPPKTSTTTIQCSLGPLQPYLTQDNYYFIGAFIGYCSYGRMARYQNHTLLRHFHYHEFFSCFFGKFNQGKSTCKDIDDGNKYKKFKETFDYHLQLGHNLVYSSEHISALPVLADPDIFPQLTDLFAGFDVHVVFTYRDYFAWLLSEYNQIYKNEYTSKADLEWPGHKPCEKCKPIGTIPPLSEELDSILNTDDLTFNALYNISSDMWKNRLYYMKRQHEFFTVDHFRMEQENDQSLMTNFVCQMLPDAKKTCSHLKSEDEKKKQENKNDDRQNASKDNELEADQLVTALFAKEWINGTLKDCRRLPLQKKLQPFLNEMKKQGSYPIVCPKKMDVLLHRTQDIVDDIVKAFNEEEAKVVVDAMNEKWLQHVEKKKFCNLNIDLFLEQKEKETKALIDDLSCTANFSP